MSLLNNLVAYWSLGEASGTRNDSHGANHLTDTNTVTQAVGKQGNAAQFTAANSEQLSVVDNAALSVAAGQSLTVAGWSYGDTIPANATMAAKWNSGGTNSEYMLTFGQLTANRFEFIVRNAADTATASVPANALGAPVVATWYFIVCWYDDAAQTINIQVNGGTVDSAAHATGVRDGTESFRLGAISSSGYWNGREDEVGVWKRVLTAAERTYLYNGGAGRSFAEVQAYGASPSSSAGKRNRLLRPFSS